MTEIAIEIIKKFEDFRAEPYKCPAGKSTIGYGSTYYINGDSVQMSDRKITEKEAETLLIKFCEELEEKIKSLLTVDLKENQMDALISFVYNVGIGNFKKSTLLKLINKKAEDILIYEEFLKWKYSKGKVMGGLFKRRVQEANIYINKKQ